MTPVPARLPHLVLAMLVIAYTLNFVDRQVIGILAGPIKAELALSDTELGLMGGVAFAIFYGLLGIPMARLADRWSRSGVISGSIALWSAFTALCGVAPGFWSLFFCRMGVGVGEAGGVAPSYALIADAVPRESRSRALAIFAFGSPIGTALGVFLGGWIATRVDWRVAFIALGVAGVAFAPIFRALVREPARAELPRDRAPAIWPHLARNGTFWLLAFAAASTSLVGYGLLFWLPSFFSRSHGFTLLETSRIFGGIVLVGGVLGLWAGGWLADRRAMESRRAYALVPALALALAVPLYAAGVLVTSFTIAIPLLLLPHALGLMWIGPVTGAVQGLVPPAARASASAVFLLVLNVVGIGGGALFFGAVSDAFAARFGEESLRYAILAGLGFYLVASALFFLASRRIERDWVDAPA